MNGRLICVMVVLFAILFVLMGCADISDPVEKHTTAAPTTTVNNIYVTPDGVFTDSEYLQSAATTQQSIPSSTEYVSELATEATDVKLENYTPQMIIDVIMHAVNEAKEQKNFSAHQLQEVTITLKDCTLSWAVPIINSAIGIFNGPHHFDYSFVDGSCPDPKEDFKVNATPMSAIPPSDRLFALEEGGVVGYAAYEDNGEFVYTVTLPFEFTDENVTVPYYHAQAMDYLDLGDFDFGIGEITNAVCKYPGATVTVRTDKNGKLISYEENIPMFGSGTGKLGIELSASFEGAMYECWTFDW